MIPSLTELLILTLINTFSVFIIIVVLANSINDKSYRWFTLMAVFIVGWVNFAYLGYAEKHEELAMLFYKLNGIFVSSFLFTEYVFYVEYFFKIKKVKLKWLIFAISTTFIGLILFTNTIIENVTWRGWGNEITFGELNGFFSLFAVAINIGLIYIFGSRYFSLANDEKRKVRYFLIGTVLFIFFNIIFNVISPSVFNTAKYQHFGDYAAIFFLGFTAFAIIRHKFLDIKVALTAFLISAIGIFLIVDILALSNILFEQVIKLIMFVGFVGISIVLVRSVLIEIRQKEELAKANKALDKSRQKYFDLANEQKDIIDVMGHEIRTPLSIVKQEINYHKSITLAKEDVWKSGKATPEEVISLLESIYLVENEINYTLRLVNDMLETARIDKNKLELNISEFDIVSLAKKTFDLMTKNLDAVKFELKFNSSNLRSLIVKADETRIRESIDALLSNAVKYGKNSNGGRSVIEINLEKVENNILVSIKDNGRGIDKLDLHKLGKKFSRLQPKTVSLERPGGTGLGLFVVKNIMTYHKGKLLIHSEGEGKGSTFTLSFPINLELTQNEDFQED